MASNLKASNACVNAEAASIAALLAGGYLRLYNGTQPATVDTAASGTLLAELRFPSPVGTVVNGVLTIGTVTGDISANATGNPTWFRALGANGTTAVVDGSAGIADADCVLTEATITMGGTVGVESMVITVPKA
jgi:hypothetical protein